MPQMMLGQTQTSPLLDCQHRCLKIHQQLSLPLRHQQNQVSLHCPRLHRLEAVRLKGPAGTVRLGIHIAVPDPGLWRDRA